MALLPSITRTGDLTGWDDERSVPVVTSTRSKLYRMARLLGDVQAVTSGRPSKIVKRAARKRMGRTYGRLLRKVLP